MESTGQEALANPLATLPRCAADSCSRACPHPLSVPRPKGLRSKRHGDLKVKNLPVVRKKLINCPFGRRR
ncbi:hypothetical protein SGPA1_50154 [Streptomyces misionensis JCM 4497]